MGIGFGGVSFIKNYHTFHIFNYEHRTFYITIVYYIKAIQQNFRKLLCKHRIILYDVNWMGLKTQTVAYGIFLRDVELKHIWLKRAIGTDGR